MPSPNYDNAAWFYDRLSQLVYGTALINAQRYLLPHIPPRSHILIVGGGTGWILEELTRKYPSGLHITYVEISANMMTLSRKRSIGDNQVVHINKSILDVNLPANFDAVITSFLFDNFKADTLQQVFKAIDNQLKPGGMWLNTDFQLTGKWWQYVMLKSMLVFFRKLCNVEASTLPEINGLFKNYQAVAAGSFFGDFISSKAYSKQKRFDNF